MQKISVILNKSMNLLMASCVALMCLFVFGNVILRYAFHTGIEWSEELSRFLFIWMVFLGAIGALKDHDHLGVDMLLKRLPVNVKRAVYIVSNSIILYLLWILLDGSWKLTLMNVTSKAPVTGMPYAYIYAIGVVMSVGMGIIVISNMVRVLFQKDSIHELIKMKESEEEIMMKELEEEIRDIPVYTKQTSLEVNDR